MRWLKWTGIGVWAYTGLLLLIGSFRPDFFDSALSILAQNYSQMGLLPYRDFGMVYPPGLFVLFGQILKVEGLIATSWVGLLIYLPLTLVSYKWLTKIVAPKQIAPELVGLLAYVQACTLRLVGFKGMLPMTIVILLALSVVRYLETADRKYLYLQAIGFMALPWVRWEWGLMLVLIQLVLSIWDKQVRRSAVVSTLGYGGGLLLLGKYLESQGTLELAYDYIVRMPMWLTSGYRYLPLPWSLSPRSPEMMLYPLLMVGLLILFTLVKKRDYDVKKWFAMGLVGMMLPYALGRSDFGHFLPLWMMTVVAYLVVKPESKMRVRYGLLALTVLPTIPWFLHNSNYLLPHPNQVNESIEEGIRECRALTEREIPGSIFVGRVNYDKYLFNIATLYLTKPSTPPSTRFIAEEPGIQSGCEYGEVVRSQLERAPRPILMYLELDEHKPENEATRKMKSCGKIESFLTSNPYRVIGSCEAYEHPFEVRLYK